MFPLQTVLYPTDFSETANYAFQFACAVARDHGARIVVLHVYPPPLFYGEEKARQQPDGYEDDLWRLLEAYKAPGLAGGVSYRLEEGHSVEEIVRVADEINCDLIVMGTHGRTGFGRALMGSVAEAVLRKATCPVLTVKQPQNAAEAAIHAGSTAEQTP